jgi:hypothetical protein
MLIAPLPPAALTVQVVGVLAAPPKKQIELTPEPVPEPVIPYKLSGKGVANVTTIVPVPVFAQLDSPDCLSNPAGSLLAKSLLATNQALAVVELDGPAGP